MGKRLSNEQDFIVSKEPLTSANVEEFKRQWYNRYSMKKIKKQCEFDSWWIRLKKILTFGLT